MRQKNSERFKEEEANFLESNRNTSEKNTWYRNKRQQNQDNKLINVKIKMMYINTV